MKNAKEMMSLFSLVIGINRNRTLSITSTKGTLFAALLCLLVVSSALPSQAQQKKTPYVPPAAPRSTPSPAPRPSPPAPRPAQTQSSPAPQRRVDPPPRQTPSPAQRQVPSEPQHQAPDRTTQAAPRPSQSTANPNRGQPTSQAKREAAARPQKEQAANQQKDEMKRQQEQQKEQARQQKDQMKQQQKQKKEQARQQKEEMKRQQRQEKEQARQQKELRKHPGQSANQAVPEPRPAASSGVGASASKPSHSRSAAPPIYKAPDSSAVAGKTPTGAITLTKNGSQATLQQVNSARSNLSGINRKPLPSGDVTIHPNGRLTVEAAGGRKYGVRSNGTISSYRDREKSVNFDNRGKVSSLRTANMSVRRGPNGERTIESRRADNSRVVSTGRHSGYVERNIVVGNRMYVQRTTIVNQRITTNTFIAYNYGGVALTHFVAPVFYSPAFYGWAYYPWAAPVHFGFGWFGAAWYGGPNPFFTAYPVYPSAAFWLSDYMLGETLATAYQLHEDALASKAAEAEYAADATSSDGMDDGDQPDMLQADATTPITPELKDQIAQEVNQQIEYDNFTAASPTHETGYDELPTVLGQPNHVFIVSSNLDVTTEDQQECGLQAGDLLRLASPPANDAAIVELRVASSKQMDCPAGVMVGVSLQDLQEMQNSFRSQIESGLASLTASQGHGGIPVAPPNAVAAPPRPELTSLAPVSANELTATLDEQRRQADQELAQAAASSF